VQSELGELRTRGGGGGGRVMQHGGLGDTRLKFRRTLSVCGFETDGARSQCSLVAACALSRFTCCS
jgi:hypothetical protein